MNSEHKVLVAGIFELILRPLRAFARNIPWVLFSSSLSIGILFGIFSFANLMLVAGPKILSQKPAITSSADSAKHSLGPSQDLASFAILAVSPASIISSEESADGSLRLTVAVTVPREIASSLAKPNPHQPSRSSGDESLSALDLATLSFSLLSLSSFLACFALSARRVAAETGRRASDCLILDRNFGAVLDDWSDARRVRQSAMSLRDSPSPALAVTTCLAAILSGAILSLRLSSLLFGIVASASIPFLAAILLAAAAWGCSETILGNPVHPFVSALSLALCLWMSIAAARRVIPFLKSGGPSRVASLGAGALSSARRSLMDLGEPRRSSIEHDTLAGGLPAPASSEDGKSPSI